MNNTTANKPNPRPEGVPDIQKVEWLIPVLNLDTRKQAYDIIAAKQLPESCVIRFGRRIRINADAVRDWLNGGGKTPAE